MSDDEGGYRRDDILADDIDDPYGKQDDFDEEPQDEEDRLDEEEDEDEIRRPDGDIDILEPFDNRGGREIEASERKTPRFLTKYERARIIGVRAAQIARNAPIFVNAEDERDPLKIAEQELREKKIPFIIRRYLPDGAYENWAVNELELLD